MGYKDQVKGSLDSSPGFMIRAEGMPHRTTTPDWEKETQIRIFPTPLADGGWGELRQSTEDHDFGPAVWSEPVARCLGVNESFTYITRIPGQTSADPTKLFVKAILAIIDEKPRDVPESWLQWVKRGKNKPPKIDKVKSGIFFQGMLVMSQGKLLVNQMKQPTPQYPILFMGSVSLQMSFEEMANTRKIIPNTDPVQPAYTGPLPNTIVGDDENARRQRDAIYAQMFQIDDWCSLDNGNILSFSKAPPSGQFERPHYGITIVEPLPLRQIEQQVRNCWRPWDQLLRYHTAQEQVNYLCRAFPPEAVDYALNTTEYRDLIPQSVKGAWQRYRNTQQAWSPGMQGMGVPQQQMQQMPQQGQYQQPQGQYQQPQMPTGTGAPMPQPQSTAAQPMQQLQQAPQTPAGTGAPMPQQPPQMQQQGVPLPPPMTTEQMVQSAGQQMQQPPQQPPQAPAAGGYNLSGAPVETPGQEPGIMGSGAFAQTPAEFNQPQAGAAAPQPQPQQPQQPAPGTPPQATAGGAVNTNELNSALNDLKASRDQAAGGNLGQQGQGQ